MPQFVLSGSRIAQVVADRSQVSQTIAGGSRIAQVVVPDHEALPSWASLSDTVFSVLTDANFARMVGDDSVLIAAVASQIIAGGYE